MAIDLTLPVREEAVGFLRTQGSLTALLPAGSIYGQMQPPNAPYPFIRFEEPDTTPLEFSCVDGCTVSADLGVFAEGEAECLAIARELVTVLDNASIDLGGGRRMDVRWVGGPTLRDPDDERLWHAVRRFEFEAA